jgi:hypothetical protein
MSTAPTLNDDMPRSWEGQLSELLRQHRDLSTRADARSSLGRMSKLAELYAADHPATDGFHTNIRELLRTSLHADLNGDAHAFGRLLVIAKLADRYEWSADPK